MTDLHNPYRHLTDRYSTPTLPPPPLISQNEMVARIEDARAETAVCPTCDSTIEITRTRRCYVCSETKPIAAFVRDATQSGQRAYLCKACKRVRVKAARDVVKRHVIREMFGRAS